MDRKVQELQLKRNTLEWRKQEIVWHKETKRKPGEELLKNMSVAAALVVCVAALRSGALPQLTPATDAILAAVNGDVLLDEQLGKLSFVSSMFPEATLVFGEQYHERLKLPVETDGIKHAWSEQEPYISWESMSDTVRAVMPGVVMGVYHGNGEEIMVHVMREDGTAAVYGNLADCRFSAGEQIEEGEIIGTLLPERECVMELRRDGYSIDASELFGIGS